MEDKTLTIITEDGSELLCDILFTYYSKEFNKNYVVFTSREDGVTSAARFIQKGDGSGTLEQIDTEDEWDMLEDVLNDYNNEQEKNNGNCDSNCASCNLACSEREESEE